MRQPDIADHSAVRCELTSAKNQLASIAAKLEADGDEYSARYIRIDVERAEAALQGAGAYVRWCRNREESLRAA